MNTVRDADFALYFMNHCMNLGYVLRVKIGTTIADFHAGSEGPPSGKALFMVTKNEDNTFEFAPLSDEAEVILRQYEEEQRKLFNN